MAIALDYPSNPHPASRGKARNPYVDAVRGFAILLVVLGHAIQYTTHGYDDIFLFRAIYSFHMPLFMFISGFVLLRGVQKDPFPIFLKKKSLHLLVPFFSWYFLFHYLLRGGFRTTGLKEYAIRLAQSPESGLWFLWVLFLCSLLLFATIRLHPRRAVLNILIATLLVFAIKHLTEISVFGFERVLWYLPFVFAGYLANAYEAQLRRFRWPLIAVALLIYPLFVGYWRGLDPPNIMAVLQAFHHGQDLIILGYRYLTAFSGIALSFLFVGALQKAVVFSWLVWFGKYTIDIYAIHLLFLSILGYVADTGYNLTVVVITFILSLSLALATSFLVLRPCKPLALLFLGSPARGPRLGKRLRCS